MAETLPPLVEWAEHRDDLHWHALNYRNAAAWHAEAMWQELVACVDRTVAQAVAEAVPERDELLQALKACLGMLEQASCSTGYCCCGSPVDKHGIGDGHGPVDEGDYYQSKAVEAARAAIAKSDAARGKEANHG